MRIICWNCRGIGNPRTVRALRHWNLKLCPDIIFLSETMVSKTFVESLKGRLGCSKAIGVDSIGNSGGLCILWKESCDFSLISYSNHHICGDIVDSGRRFWRFVGIYGWAETSYKGRTWELIRTLCAACPFPILLGGDFNEILHSSEKEGGPPREQRLMDGFRNALDDCALRDLGYEGSCFTWERGLSPLTRVRERLDRFVASSEWLAIYPDAQVHHLTKYKSDHLAIFLNTENRQKGRKNSRKKKSFKFETSWLLEDGIEDVVRSSWSNSSHVNIVERLRRVSSSLTFWSSNLPSNFGKEIEKVEKSLKEAQQNAKTTTDFKKCAQLEERLDDLHEKNEAYWYIRSRVSEIKDGDRNTKYFHHKASQRRSRNYIKGLYDEEGTWKTNHDEVEGLLRLAVEKKSLHGVHASRRGPEVTHLFFADDSLLFARANRRECSVIVDILNKYEAASGQKINYEKSEVSFSKGINSVIKEELSSLLGMKSVESHAKYLGLPTIFGRSKKDVFASLKEKIWKKIQGWKERLLSRAGKEVLLKAVIQAIPTYIMGVYKIPTTLVDNIHSAMARFWWGSTGDSRKIHWKSWESLCKPKCLGGMGFRDLAVFNDALLGKQLWRLIHNENSLVARVLKAKYFPHSSILEAAMGPCSSFSWRSIWSSKGLVKEGILWRVGNGSDISIWSDPWLIDDHSRFVTTAKPNETSLNVVADLIDRESKDWCWEVIDDVFNERDRDLILGIPISERLPKDEATWAWTKNGEYDVGSAYLLGSSCNVDDFERYWVEVWKAEVSPKVRHFLWRCCTSSLPTLSVLKQRHLIEDDTCPCCGLESETIFHALLSCTNVTSCWKNIGLCGSSLVGNASSFGELLLKMKESLNDNQSQCCFYLMWSLWHRRNLWVFDKFRPPDEVFMRGVQRAVADFRSYSNRIYGGIGPTQPLSNSAWTPPPEGIIKINVDASVSEYGWVGMGAVARNCRGDVLFAAVRRVRARWKPFVAECRAAMLGLRKAKDFGLSNISLESDNLGLITKIKNEAFSLAEVDNVMEDLVSFSKAFQFLSWSHVKRDGNSVAHHLARLVPKGVEQVWENDIPPDVIPHVIMDNLSI